MRMTDLKIPPIWKDRIVAWCRDLILIFAMWSIWLGRVYVPDIEYSNIITGFQITIIAFIILLGEHYRAVDYSIRDLESEYNKIKNMK